MKMTSSYFAISPTSPHERKFYASKNDCKKEISLRNYVFFEWKNVGMRTLAIEVEPVDMKAAIELATQTKNLLPQKLREKWNDEEN